MLRASSLAISRKAAIHDLPVPSSAGAVYVFTILDSYRDTSRSSTASDSVCPRIIASCAPSREKANCAIFYDVKCVSCR